MRKRKHAIEDEAWKDREEARVTGGREKEKQAIEDEAGKDRKETGRMKGNLEAAGVLNGTKNCRGKEKELNIKKGNEMEEGKEAIGHKLS